MWVPIVSLGLSGLKSSHLYVYPPLVAQNAISLRPFRPRLHCRSQANSEPSSLRVARQLTVVEEKELLKAAAHSVAELLDLADTYPHNIHFPLAAARLLAKEGKHDEADVLFASAEAKAPTPADRSFVMVGWATHQMHNGRASKAEELLLSAVAASPEMAAPLNALAKLRERQGNYAEAEDFYRQSLGIDPNNVIGAQSLGVLLARRGDVRAATELFKKTAEAVPTHAPTWQAWAMHEWRQGKYAVAKTLFEKAIEKCEPHSPLYVAYAKMEAQRRNRTKARALLRQASTIDPRNPHTWVSWAQLEGREGNHYAAIEICKQALAANPKNMFILCTLGQINADAGRKEDAIAAWEEALQNDPRCAVAAHELGNVFRQEGDLSRAEDLFLMGLDCGDAKGARRCACGLAEIKVFQQDARGAREVLKTASEKFQPDGRLLRDWAGVEKRLGDLSAAAVLYKKAAEMEPRDERTWLQWGQLERRRGEIDNALRCWQTGLKVSPLNPFLWQLCGITLWDAGKVDAARATFSQGLKYCPSNQPLLLEWALKEAESGDAQAALEIFRLSKGGAPHVPLLAAWARLARQHGHEQEAVAVEERIAAAGNSEGEKKNKKRGKPFKRKPGSNGMKKINAAQALT